MSTRSLTEVKPPTSELQHADLTLCNGMHTFLPLSSAFWVKDLPFFLMVVRDTEQKGQHFHPFRRTARRHHVHAHCRAAFTASTPNGHRAPTQHWFPFSSPPHPAPPATILLSVFMNLVTVGTSHKYNHVISVLLCPACFISICLQGSFAFQRQNLTPWYGWKTPHVFIWPSTVDTWVVHAFWLLWVTRLCKWAYECLFQCLLSLLLDTLRVEQLNHTVALCLIFQETATLFLTATVPLSLSASSVQGLTLCVSLTMLLVFSACFVAPVLVNVKW